MIDLNFLAHIALSGNNTEITIGNFIADSILPKERSLLSAEMQKGISLHHAIDKFTDSHRAFKNTVRLLQPSLRKYAPVATDVFYDHFLAINFQQYFPAQSLYQFSKTFYASLEEHKNSLPGKGKDLATYIIQYDWLNMYESLEGLHAILTQMSKRTRFESHLDSATEEMKKYYEEINNDFQCLFPELMEHCKNFMNN